MPIHDWTRVGPGIFHDFYLVWMGRLKGILNEELLPRPFYALAEPILGEAEPDVIALEAQLDPYSGPVDGGRLHSDATEGAVALAPSGVVVEDIVPDPYARKTRRIAIKDAVHGDRVVAVIEIVSSGNKTSRSRVESFVRKSADLLERGIHLVLIDLQAPTPLVPRGFHSKISSELGHEPSPAPADRLLSVVSYQVLETTVLRAHFVPLMVADRLPDLAVFLGAHEFVRLPLEATYGESFRTVPWKYRDVIEGLK